MSRPSRLSPWAVILAVSGSFAVSAQQPGDAPQVFRGGVDLVVVDVIVRDGAGDVVRGLTADDFELFEDGQPQTIVSFNFEEVVTTPRPAIVAPLLRTDLTPTITRAPRCRPPLVRTAR